MGDSEPCPHAVTCQLAVRDAAATQLILRNLLDACERGRPLSDIHDRLRVEVARLGPSTDEGTAQPEPSEIGIPDVQEAHRQMAVTAVQWDTTYAEVAAEMTRLREENARLRTALRLSEVALADWEKSYPDLASGEGTAPPTREQVREALRRSLSDCIADEGNAFTPGPEMVAAVGVVRRAGGHARPDFNSLVATAAESVMALLSRSAAGPSEETTDGR